MKNNTSIPAPASAGAYRVSQTRRRARYVLVFLVLILAFYCITVLNINIGNVPIPLSRIVEILLTKAGNSTEVNIIWKIRLPRIFMAAILGGALSLSGFLLQTFFENPIAGPFVLGISSGAKMVVAFAMIYFMEAFGIVSSYTLILAAFIGSLLSVGFILLFSRRIPNMSTLLVAGIMIGYICTAITDFTVTFAADSDIVNLHNWSKGSFSGMSWSNVGVARQCGGHYNPHHLPDGKAHRGLSAGRSLRPEHGREHQGIPHGSHPAFQHSLRYGDGLRRTYFLRGHRRAPS